MDKELGLTDADAQIAISAFFVLYVLLEVPSNIMLKKATPLVWIARIMVSWGLACMALGAVQGPTSLWIVRAILGAFEAGFFPGIIYYLTFWFRPFASLRGFFT